MTLFKRDENRLRGTKVPMALWVGKFLLFVMLFLYVMNMLAIVYPDNLSTTKLIINLIYVTYTVIASVLAADAFMGLTSSKLKAWRKVLRSALMMVLTALFTEALSHFGIMTSTIGIGLVGAVILSVLVAVIMFLPHVRRFYIPSVMDVPPVKEWILFIFAKPIVSAEEYRFTYDKPAEGAAEERKPEDIQTSA